MNLPLKNSALMTAIFMAALLLSSCVASSADSVFFGRTDPPDGDVLRYVTGSEPESLDPQIPSGQPEARIVMSIFDGLIEYDPKTMEPIPSLAERWEANSDSTVFTFHLRQNGKWSNGEPITADDFVYTFRRGLNPTVAARNAYLSYVIKYAQGYNEGAHFVRDIASGAFDTAPTSGDRLIVPQEGKAAPGKELVPIKAEDIGVEAPDSLTVRVTLTQPAPFFAGMMAHQFFRAVPRKAVEAHGSAWTRPENIVTSGAFTLKEWVPYDKIVVGRSPTFWDAASVRLDEIRFYPLEDTTTIMNLYKAGAVDATLNHSIPPGWLDVIRKLKDYMDAPELANEYYQMNVKRPPLNDVRVRRAFNMAIDKVALARFRGVAKPLTAFVPEGILPGYPQEKGDSFDPETARQLMIEAGFKNEQGQYDASKFPASEVEITYNTSDTHRQVAEFIQAEWKRNLGITVTLRNMEFRTFLVTRASLDYQGFARSGWVGDYLDPFSYLNIFYTPAGDNGTGWWDPRYVEMLDEANRTLDPQLRYRKLADAEAYMLKAQPVIPLMTRSTDWMKKPYVKGMYPNPGTMHAWKFVYIERDSSKWDYGVPSMTP